MSDEHYLKRELDKFIKSDIFVFEFIESNSLDGIWFWDLENKDNIWMSEKFWKTLGYDPKLKKHLATQWQELVYEDDLSLALENFQKHLEDKNYPYDQILRFKHSNGSTLWIRCAGLAIRDENDKPIRMIGTHTDMTIVMDSLKKLEKYSGLNRLNEDLQEKYNAEYKQRIEVQRTNRDIERYISLIDKFIITLSLDFNGNIVNASNAFCKVSGYSKSELIGKDHSIIIYPDEQLKKLTKLDELTKDEKSWEGEVKCLKKDGTTYWVYSTLSALYNDNNEKIGYSILSIDITDKNVIKQNNIELKTVKETLDNAVKIAKLGTWEWDLKNNNVNFSKIAYEMFGADTSERLDFNSLKEYVIKDDKKRYKRIINRAVKKKISFSFEYRIYKDSEIRKIWVIGNPIVENNELLRMSGVVQDVTELKQVEEELEEAQKIARVGHYHYNLNKDVFTNSYIIDEIFGFDERMNKGLKIWQEGIHSDDKKRVGDYFNKIIKTKEKFDVEYRVVNRKDKLVRWVHMLGELSFGRKGEITTFFGTIQDTTKRKEIENDLQQAHNVFENTHDGILVTDENGHILNVNKSFEIITGYKLEEVIGQNPSILKSGVHEDNFYENLWKEVRTNGYWSGEIHNKSKFGKIYQELLTINAIYDENGYVCNYIGLFSDITKQRKQDKLILQQSRTAAVGEMLENIAHQWRQPLSIISTSATGLKFQLEMDDSNSIPKEQVLTVLDDVNKYAQYLSETIEDFRSFFKGDMTQIRKFDINDTLSKIESLTKDSFSHNFINFIDETQKDEVIIENNENILTQALINIYNNAKDALIEGVDEREKRYFFAYSEKRDNFYYLHFRDNAGGIKKNIMNQIFDPYFTTKHESIGTGLGLYMTYQIITKQLKGVIEVHNVTYTYKGEIYKGAEFMIGVPYIPIK